MNGALPIVAVFSWVCEMPSGWAIVGRWLGEL